MKKILLSLLLVVTLAVPLPAFAETTGAESQTGAEAQTEAPQARVLIPRNGLVRTSLIQT